MPSKKKAGGKGKTPRADKAPPTPNSAKPQQQNSALPSPEKTPTAATKPHSLPGSPYHTPPTSPTALVVGLPADFAPLDAERETEDASVAQGELQLPTPREPDAPLPTVTEGETPASQEEPAANAEVNGTEPQPGDSVSANLGALLQTKELEAGGLRDPSDLLEPDRPTPTSGKDAEAAVLEDGFKVDDVEVAEDLQTLSQATEDFDKPLPPPPVGDVPEDEENNQDRPEDPFLQASEATVAESQDHTVGLADLGEQQDQETLLEWDDWSGENMDQQLDETLMNFNESTGASIPEVPDDPDAQHDTGSEELSAEVAPISDENQEHAEDLTDFVSFSQADEAPLLDTMAPAGEESQVVVSDVAEESEHIGELVEQPLEGVEEGAAFENREMSAEEGTGDPIEQPPTDNNIVDFSENHELDITEEGGDLIEEQPVDNHVVDTGEAPERDITEAGDDPLEQPPADDEHVAVDISQSADLETIKDTGDRLEQAPIGDNVVDIDQNPSLEIDAHDVSDSRQEDTSLTEVQADLIIDGQTTEDTHQNVGTENWEVDGIPGEGESDPAQQPHKGGTLFADSDGSAVGDILTEGASHPEGTTSIGDLESMEQDPEAQAIDTEAADTLDSNAAPEPDVAEGQPLDTSEEPHSDELKEDSLNLQSSDESSNPPASSTQPGDAEEKLQSEVDSNVGIASEVPPEHIELGADIAPDDLEGIASFKVEGTELLNEPHDSLTVLPPTDSIPEAEKIPHSPVIALGLDLLDPKPSINIDTASQSDDQRAELMAQTDEMAVSENRTDTQMDVASEAPPPATQSNDIPVASATNGVAVIGQESNLPALSAQDVATPEIIAISEMFSTMRTALLAMTSAFDRLGVQTERMAANSLHIKAVEQLAALKAALGHQIARQKTEVEALRLALQSKIKQAAEEKIRAHLRDVIKQAVKAQVEEKVRAQMAVQIPDDLRQQVISHQRQIIQVKTALHNSEARMYNALQTVPGGRLRPLLRPLPTPEQSPVAINISRSSSMGNTTLGTPRTAFPSGPAPTPIRRSVSNSMRPGGGLETVPPTPSKFFPRDLTALFALSQDEARRLLREYGLKSTAPSPAIENNTPMRARGLSIVSEEGAEEDLEVHARDMNTFMAHIGVPFLMIPPPKEKPGDEMPPLSSRSRRKMLTPLIIK